MKKRNQVLSEIDFDKFCEYAYSYYKANKTITYKQFCEGLKDYNECSESLNGESQ